MDISKIKDVIGKFGVLRSYSSLVLPVMMTAVGIGILMAAFVMGRSFRQKVERESVPMGRQIALLAQAAPARAQVEVEKEYTQRYETDVNRMGQLVIQTTQRELLSYRLFPTPKDTSMMIFDEFGKEYCRAIEKLVADVNGRDCPSDTELADATKKAGSAQGGRVATRFLGTGGTEGAIVDALCRQKAESACVYANPADMAGYSLWQTYQRTTMEEGLMDCWYWQVGYWITEDIFETIKAMNRGSMNVYTSPVKRLMTVNFARGGRGYTPTGRSKSRGSSERPSYAVGSKNLLALSPTGRLTNNEIDVVHFNMQVLVATEQALGFMEKLCSGKEHEFRGYANDEAPRLYKRNQITVLESRIRSISRDSAAHRLYRYGLEGLRDDAVVEVELICEYVFVRPGYEQVKPQSVEADIRGMQTAK